MTNDELRKAFDNAIGSARCVRCQQPKKARYEILCDGCYVAMRDLWPPPTGTLDEAFEAIHKASGGAFDNVDVEKYVRELRGEE